MSVLAVRLCGWLILEVIWAVGCLIYHPIFFLTLGLVGFVLGTLFVLWVFSLISYGAEFSERGIDL